MPERIDDTDIELYIQGDVPKFVIEVYVPGDAKYSLAADKLSLSVIRRQFDQGFGVSQIGDVTLTLKNEDNQYNENHADSIFYGEQVLKDWVRIKCGWGVGWQTDVETQFQGRIKHLETTNDWEARMILYDALKDLEETIVGSGGLEISLTASSGLTSMNPIDILEYLIDTKFALPWFNMDTLSEESLLDATALAAAKTATEGLFIGDTTWPAGTKVLAMVADLMKMCGGYIYSGKDGKLYTAIYAPSQSADSALSAYAFIGDVTTKEPEVLISKRDLDTTNIVNRVAWKYGQAQTEYTSADEDSTSQSDYGVQALNLTTGWEVDPDTFILDIAASRIMARFAEPAPSYEMDISFLKNGDGLAMDLGDFVAITDPALNITNEYVEVHRMRVALDKQEVQGVAYDTSALQGKFWFFSSEIDEGDGWGITGGTFATNWLRRFLFFSEPDSAWNPAFDKDGNSNMKIDPTLAPIDDWGNGIEEHFIFW